MIDETKTDENKRADTFGKVALAVIGIAGLLLIVTLFQLNDAKYVVKETAAYTRVSNCIVAKSGTENRTADGVEKCYVQVEKDSGISLERFDKQLHNEGSYK